MRVEHLHDAISIPTGDEGGRISKTLAEVASNLAQGFAPDALGPWLAGAFLFPIRKKDGGVRPIAVGEVLRRLVSKVCCHALKEQTDIFFSGIGQVGVGIKGGAEAAVQAVRLSLGDLHLNQKMALKVDISNAFNEVSRQAILAELQEHFPMLEQWFRLCYAQPAVLSCNGTILSFRSELGVQQGDPLAPLFFALALSPCCRRLRTELNPEPLRLVPRRWYFGRHP